MSEKLIPIFDLDDTLYCEHDYVRSGFREVAKVISITSNINPNILYEDLIKVWLLQGRGKVFDVLCKTHNIKMDISALVKVYRNHVPKIKLYVDAKEVFSFFKAKQIPMGLITDGDSTMQWRKIEALGLKELFNVIVVTNDLGNENWKPSPIPYLKAAQQFGVPVERCVYIGDNPNKDFITARKLGMKTFRIIRPIGDHMNTKLSGSYEADKVIHTLLDLQKDWGKKTHEYISN